MTGTVELLPAGSFGVDFSFGRPSLADMETLGVQFVSRYVCIDNALTHDKLWTLDQVRFYADAGILAMVNYEQGDSTTLGGATAGVRHGKVAADWRHYLQMPPELPIVISTDVGVTRSQYPAIADFCAAFIEESGGPVGHYHGTALCGYLEDRGLNELTWMAMATSWSPGGETSQVHVRQKGYVLGSCDANYVRKPTPFWNFNGEPFHPTEDDNMTDQEKAALFADVAAIKEALLGVGPSLDPNNRPMDRRYTQHYTYTIAQDITNQVKALEAKVDALGSGAGGALTREDVKAIIDSTFLTTG